MVVTTSRRLIQHHTSHTPEFTVTHHAVPGRRETSNDEFSKGPLAVELIVQMTCTGTWPSGLSDHDEILKARPQ